MEANEGKAPPLNLARGDDDSDDDSDDDDDDDDDDGNITTKEILAMIAPLRDTLLEESREVIRKLYEHFPPGTRVQDVPRFFRELISAEVIMDTYLHFSETLTKSILKNTGEILPDYAALVSEIRDALGKYSRVLSDNRRVLLDNLAAEVSTSSPMQTTENDFMKTKGQLLEMVAVFMLCRRNPQVTNVEHVGKSRDRGVDIKFVENGVPCIAQCKQGKQWRKKSSAILREAVGAAVLAGVRRITIFCTGKRGEITSEVSAVLQSYEEQGYVISIMYLEDIYEALANADDDEIPDLLTAIDKKKK